MTQPAATTTRKETGTDLWRAIIAPIIWSAHFLACYVVAAVYCEKAGRSADLMPVSWMIVGLTAAALLGIGICTASLWRVRARSLTDEDFEYDHNSPEERHRFLSHVGLMLCVLSAVAVIYVALPAIYLSSCR